VGPAGGAAGGTDRVKSEMPRGSGQRRRSGWPSRSPSGIDGRGEPRESRRRTVAVRRCRWVICRAFGRSGPLDVRASSNPSRLALAATSSEWGICSCDVGLMAMWFSQRQDGGGPSSGTASPHSSPSRSGTPRPRSGSESRSRSGRRRRPGARRRRADDGPSLVDARSRMPRPAPVARRRRSCTARPPRTAPPRFARRWSGLRSSRARKWQPGGAGHRARGVARARRGDARTRGDEDRAGLEDPREPGPAARFDENDRAARPRPRGARRSLPGPAASSSPRRYPAVTRSAPGSAAVATSAVRQSTPLAGRSARPGRRLPPPARPGSRRPASARRPGAAQVVAPGSGPDVEDAAGANPGSARRPRSSPGPSRRRWPASGRRRRRPRTGASS
jgi:hypothetical protein